MSLAQQVKDAGVVGAGGAGFPAHIKVQAKAGVVIANGAECEPLLRVDQQLMAAYAAEIIEGLELVRSEVGARRAVVALKQKYKQALQALQTEIARRSSSIELFSLGSFYPAGDEQVLVYEVTGKVVPEGGIPLDVGVVVSNVGTLLNISRASQGIPVTTRFLTLGGAIARPITLEVPIGALVDDVLKAGGGAIPDEFEVIDGGPVMGIISDGIVSKTTTGLIVLPKDHKQIKYRLRPLEHDIARASQACDQCRFCTDYCPRYLLGHRIEPHKIMRLVGQQRFDAIPREDLDRAWFCCQCGLCGMFACPTTLSPDRVIRALLDSLNSAQQKKPEGNQAPTANLWREGRRVPVEVLSRRIDVAKYENPAPLLSDPLEVDRVRIKLKQHVGVACLPLVSLGEQVTKGQIIAQPPPESLGAMIHASITGVVNGVFEEMITIRKEAE